VRLEVAFTPAEVRGTAGRAVVVIDVLRATSTIIEALVSGARSVVPAASVEDATRLAEQIGRDAVLLCGERDCQPIRGFHLGNSPAEFTPDRVAGKTLIMTTTNGTGALLAAGPAERVDVASLMNVSAVAEQVAGRGTDTVLLCAGREGSFALEDAICAGRIIRRVQDLTERTQGNDAALAALRLAASAPTARALARTAAGRRLREQGFARDVSYCAVEDRHTVVPYFDRHRIRLDP
jgi:2-phosphosulfolactate phosphatase